MRFQPLIFAVLVACLGLGSLGLGACGATLPRLPARPTEGLGAAPGPPPLADFRWWIERSKKKDYPLCPGDRIKITVQGHEDLTVEREIPPTGLIPLYGLTGPDGELTAPLVKVAGKRIPELEKELQGRYGRDISPAYVTVTVTRHAEKYIYLAGEGVVKPGRYPLSERERVTVTQAIAIAGGLTATAERDRVLLRSLDPVTGRRADAPPIDLAWITAGEYLELDLMLEPGDTITVGSLGRQSVYVEGHIGSPGEYPYTRGLTLTMLVSLAGGFRPFAKSGDIRVMRGGTTYGVDLEKVYDGEEADPLLAPGDRIKVPERFI